MSNLVTFDRLQVRDRERFMAYTSKRPHHHSTGQFPVADERILMHLRRLILGYSESYYAVDEVDSADWRYPDSGRIRRDHDRPFITK